MDEEKKTPAEKPKTSEKPSEEKKGIPEGVSKTLSVLTLIFLALAIAGLAYVFGSKKGEPEESPSPTAEATAEPEDEEGDEEESPSPSPAEEPTEEPSPTPESKADLYITEYSFDPTPEKQVEFTVVFNLS